MFQSTPVRRLRGRLAWSACAALCASSLAHAATITNGGFEQPGLGFRSVAAGETYGAWTCDGPDDIEFVRAEVNPALPGLEFAAYEGEYIIDLCGVGRPSAIYQDILDLAPGGLYRVDFAFAANLWGPDTLFVMDVLWNGSTVGTFSRIAGGSNGAAMGWENKFVDVVGTGNDRLMFRALTSGQARGAAIDAVSISAIPSPGVLALASLGLLSGTRRRRR